jgi:polysaccharide biosynthesis/export protein
LHKPTFNVRRIFFILLGLLVLLFAQSCSYKRSNLLLKTPKRIKSKEPVLVVNRNDTSKQVYRHRIKVGDRLAIRFLNNYDIGSAAGQSATAALSAENNYLVNYDSTVILPLLGRINLVGLTRLEAAERLEKEYGKFVVNPIIDVNIPTLSVTLIGESGANGKVTLDKENTTLLDVIAKSGGIKDSGKKRDIKIIRGTEIIVVDLRKIETLQYPDIIMHDNDIVYVEPYKVKANSEALLATQPIFTYVTATLQLALFIANVYLIAQSR